MRSDTAVNVGADFGLNRSRVPGTLSVGSSERQAIQRRDFAPPRVVDMPADSHDREFPIAKWVAALEVALRAGDWNAATAAAAELKRLGVVITIPGLGTEIRPAKGEEGSRPHA